MKKIQNRNKSLKTNASRRLASYVSAGVCVSGTAAWAAIDVTFYEPDSWGTSPLRVGGSGGAAYVFGALFIQPRAVFGKNFDGTQGPSTYWTQGADLNTNAYGQIGLYRQSGIFVGGAVDGINYASISFDGADGVYEAVGKFDLGDFNVGDDAQLIAIAVSDQGALSISDGVVAIDSAAVPEPSGMLLGLLALGSSACARRRARPVRG